MYVRTYVRTEKNFLTRYVRQVAVAKAEAEAAAAVAVARASPAITYLNTTFAVCLSVRPCVSHKATIA